MGELMSQCHHTEIDQACVCVYVCVCTHNLKHSLTHAHALLSSKGSVAYKLAAVSSQSLCRGRGRKDKLLRLDRTDLNEALLGCVILGRGF